VLNHVAPFWGWRIAYFHVKPTNTSYYFFAFAAGNLLGPLTLGHLFDTIGRKKMISGTYITAGALLIVTAVLFKNGTSPPPRRPSAGRSSSSSPPRARAPAT